MAVTILEARIAQGYSGNDHLITGRECDEVVGREFDSVADACEAADEAASRNAEREVTAPGPHVRLKIELDTGDVIERTT